MPSSQRNPHGITFRPAQLRLILTDTGGGDRRAVHPSIVQPRLRRPYAWVIQRRAACRQGLSSSAHPPSCSSIASRKTTWSPSRSGEGRAVTRGILPEETSRPRVGSMANRGSMKSRIYGRIRRTLSGSNYETLYTSRRGCVPRETSVSGG